MVLPPPNVVKPHEEPHSVTKISGLTRDLPRLDGNVVTEFAKLSAERRRFAPFLSLGEIRQFGLFISSALAKDGEHALEKRVVDGNDGALRAAPSFQPIVEGPAPWWQISE